MVPGRPSQLAIDPPPGYNLVVRTLATRRLARALTIPAFLIVAGTVGYHRIEGWSLFDSLYMTVITLATVGFGEVHPLSVAGRTFTIFLTLGGVFTLFYAATALIRAVVGGEFQTILGRQRMEQRLAELRNHVIVCGYGRMGRQVCEEFAHLGTPFVVIESMAERLAGFSLSIGVAVPGDATEDEVLLQAGIKRAQAVVAVLGSDADNLYITMSARLLNETAVIVARAEDARSEPKFLRAGATRVVSPYVIGGYRVAHAVLRPSVVDFIELATRSEHLELQMEETVIGGASQLAGVHLAERDLAKELSIILVAIKRASGEMIFNPPPEAVLAIGDRLITLGSRQNLDRLETMAAG